MTKMYKSIYTDIFTLYGALLVFINTCEFATSQFLTFKVFLDGCSIKEDFISDSFTTSSNIECAMTAASRGLNATSWHLASSTCRVSDGDIRADRQCEWIAGWSTFVRERYPVFHARGSNSKHDMSFAQAQSMCEGYGTTLASSDDMTDAYAMGFYWCACGWLSDGSNGIVLQLTSDVCNSSPNNAVPGILNYCSLSKADAYCKSK